MEDCGINFTNEVHNTNDLNIFSYRNFFNGGGVALGDIDNDGLADICFTANLGTNKLYHNKGNFTFDDISEKSGIEEQGYWSTGVTMVDINQDGWLDIFLCHAGYINRQLPFCRLFINNKDLSFTESAKSYGLENFGGHTTQAAFFDYDLDGDLDCYLLNNSFIPVNTLNYASKRELRSEHWPVPDYLKGGGDKLMRNDGGKFTDVSESANIYGSLTGFGLGIAVGDINGDRFPDIYISNDFFERDFLYINQRNGSFKESLEDYMQHISHSSMGADIGDVNNDGFSDVFVTEMLPDEDIRLKTTTAFENIDILKLKQRSGFYNQFMQNTLQISNGNGKFSETAFYSGVAASDWSWGGLIFDADNDGLNDLYVTNGINQDLTNQDFIDFFANNIINKAFVTNTKEDKDRIFDKMPSVPVLNKMYKNTGNLRFEDVAEIWGMNQKSFSNGAAYGDLDNDGDIDLVVNNVNQKAFVFRNKSRELNRNNYIGFRLKGNGANRFAVGAMVKVFQKKQVLSKELFLSRGFQSSVAYDMIFGLSKGEVDSAWVIWPDRKITKINKPGINALHEFRQPEKGPLWLPTLPVDKGSALLTIIDSASFEKHRENDFNDFYFERNIPEMLSREGPKAAIADVNGDGMDDIYIGGASGQGGQLYLQSRHGFIRKPLPGSKNTEPEDVAVLFFDVDMDGDKDLFVGAGGNEQGSGSEVLQHRLLRNDGKGNFSAELGAFPENDMNISTAVENDYDKDGDLDLFVAGRSVPFKYGKIPRSYLFQNDGTGHFRDVTLETIPQLFQAGMVTGMGCADVYGDAGDELIIVGEWMSPKIFSLAGKQYREIPTNLSSLNGLWQTLTVADMNNDGRKDLLLGNIGTNFGLKSNFQQSVKLWFSDFDTNGSEEAIITKMVNGKDKPVFLKKELTDQLPFLKKQNLKHEQYATRSINDLFTQDVLNKCSVLSFNFSASCIAYNEGNGKFKVRELPFQVNLSSVNAFFISDLNKDGLKDIVIGGNNFALQPQFGRLDGSYGALLLNRDNKNFEWQPAARSGLEIPGVVRELKSLVYKDKLHLLLLRNNEKPVLYSISGENMQKN